MKGIFKQHIQALQKYKTPATPGQTIFKCEDPLEVVNAEIYSLYRGGVRMLYIWSSSPNLKLQMRSEKLLRSMLDKQKHI
jgi:hypothetical protein